MPKVSRAEKRMLDQLKDYFQFHEERERSDPFGVRSIPKPKPKRKLSAWNKFVKANSSKPRFRLRSGSPNLKKLGVAFRKTPAGKKKRR